MPIVNHEGVYYRTNHRTECRSVYNEEKEIPTWSYEWPSWAISEVNKLSKEMSLSKAISQISTLLEKEGFKNGNCNLCTDGN